MILLATFLASLGGFAALSLSMPKHRDAPHLEGLVLRSGRTYRVLGWGLLAGSIICVTLMETALTVALTTWVVLLTASALSVALLLTYRRRELVTVAFATPIAALVSLIVGLG